MYVLGNLQFAFRACVVLTPLWVVFYLGDESGATFQFQEIIEAFTFPVIVWAVWPGVIWARKALSAEDRSD